MKIFSPLYKRAMQWARHAHAPWYLSGLSFAESSFFPVPPDVMLAPMAMAKPDHAARFAAYTTIASVLGGVLGYLIGVLGFDLVEPLLHDMGKYETYLQVKQWFAEWGFWAILVAGFSPIPYKLFTITAGVVSLAFLPFVLASLVGRGARFYLVALIMARGGAAMESKLHRYIDTLGWLMVVVIAVAVVVMRH